jgi:hypothetical protein
MAVQNSLDLRGSAGDRRGSPGRSERRFMCVRQLIRQRRRVTRGRRHSAAPASGGGRGPVRTVLLRLSGAAASIGFASARRDDRRAGRAVHHYQSPAGFRTVRSEHQPAHRVVTHLIDSDRVVDGMEDVLDCDAMAQRRAENLHPGTGLRNYGAPAGKPPGDRWFCPTVVTCLPGSGRPPRTP